MIWLGIGLVLAACVWAIWWFRRLNVSPSEVMLCINGMERGTAYGVSIAKRLESIRGRDVNLGSLYANLVRLEQLGILTSYWGDASPERGGHRERIYEPCL